jgi:hypothetical protein
MEQPTIFRNLTLLMSAIALTTGGLAVTLNEAPGRFPLPAEGRTYFGIQLDSEYDTVDGYAARLGSTPALYGRYVNFPPTAEDESLISNQVQDLAKNRSSLMLTIEPREDLSVVTPQSLTDLTRALTDWNRKGVPVMVRFAHEMNGSWYPWAQQPAAYIDKFRQVADAVHKAPASAMLWSPNEGGGYPFEGGPYAARAGTPDFQALDTNHDGKLSMDDDPYAPYWPGDDAVDWVGLSLYHFGYAYPWGENTIPEPGKLAAKISGTYKNPDSDQTALPDFYADYATGHHKPFAISETAAFYNTSRSDGAPALAIKEAWWNQLFDPDLQQRFPQLKLAVWFEFSKEENQPGNPVIDWRTTADPATAEAFAEALPNRFAMAPLKK